VSIIAFTGSSWASTYAGPVTWSEDPRRPGYVPDALSREHG